MDREEIKERSAKVDLLWLPENLKERCSNCIFIDGTFCNQPEVNFDLARVGNIHELCCGKWYNKNADREKIQGKKQMANDLRDKDRDMASQPISFPSFRDGVQRGLDRYSKHDEKEFSPSDLDLYKTVDLTNEESIQNPGKVDEALWAKAKRASQHAFGEIKYAFVTWWYKQHGGKFS